MFYYQAHQIHNLILFCQLPSSDDAITNIYHVIIWLICQTDRLIYLCGLSFKTTIGSITQLDFKIRYTQYDDHEIVCICPNNWQSILSNNIHSFYQYIFTICSCVKKLFQMPVPFDWFIFTHLRIDASIVWYLNHFVRRFEYSIYDNDGINMETVRIPRQH